MMTKQEIKKELEEIKDMLHMLAKQTRIDDLSNHKRIADAYFAVARTVWDFDKEYEKH